MHIASLRGLMVALALLALAAPALAAERVGNLYEAEVGVTDKDVRTRAEAFGAALLQVAVKVSGSRGAATSPVIVEAMESPDRFVQQFRYRNADPPVGGDEAPDAPPLVLRVQFDPRAVDELIRQAGLPVWGRVRPSVLVLVAVESGAGRELLASDDARGWGAYVRRVAAERAVPMVLPLMDLEDRGRLRATDVWAGFEDAVRPAAARYQAEGVLLGRAYERLPNFWEARWRLLLEDGRHEWIDQGEGLDAVLFAGINESADLLASRFGGFTAAVDATGVQVDVAGVRTLADYARTLGYLDSLDQVSRVDVIEVASDRVSFRLDARGGREGVRQVIALGRTLVESGQADPGGGLSYRLAP